jgi:anti-sigma regulatory factor (Ser/Thr protein kinase)
MSAGIAPLSCDDVGHVVRFYGHDDELVDEISRYLRPALDAGGVGLVVATPAHALAVERALAAAGIDIPAARADGTLIVLDAAETVHRLLVDGGPDPVAFDAVIGSLIGRLVAERGPVRVFGEMVALLWAGGQVTAALELENLWNELGRRLPFSLLCAYPQQAVAAAGSSAAFGEIGCLHSAVLGAPPTAGDETIRTFGQALDAPRAARRFVIDTLRADAVGLAGATAGLVDDAALVVTELATNAVVHARSDFTVVVSWSHDRVRISVRDASPVPPTDRPASLVACSGRGLAVVAALAARWSFEPLGFGKVVWAELRRP